MWRTALIVLLCVVLVAGSAGCVMLGHAGAGQPRPPYIADEMALMMPGVVFDSFAAAVGALGFLYPPAFLLWIPVLIDLIYLWWFHSTDERPEHMNRRPHRRPSAPPNAEHSRANAHKQYR